MNHHSKSRIIHALFKNRWFHSLQRVSKTFYPSCWTKACWCHLSSCAPANCSSSSIYPFAFSSGIANQGWNSEPKVAVLDGTKHSEWGSSTAPQHHVTELPEVDGVLMEGPVEPLDIGLLQWALELGNLQWRRSSRLWSSFHPRIFLPPPSTSSGSWSLTVVGNMLSMKTDLMTSLNTS